MDLRLKLCIESSVIRINDYRSAIASADFFTDTIDYRKIGFSYNHPNPIYNVTVMNVFY